MQIFSTQRRLNEVELNRLLEFDPRLRINDGGWPRFNLRDSEVWQNGFWTDRNRWPVFNGSDGYAIRVRWLGLVLSLTVLVFACLIVANLLERRRGLRGRHLSFTMLEGLLVLTLVCIATSLLVSEYRRAAKESEIVETLFRELEPTNLGTVQGRRSNGLPLVVSELFDHRSKIPFTNLNVFRPVSRANLGIYPSYVRDPKEASTKLTEAIRQARFDIFIDFEINKKSVELLQSIAGAASIQEVEIEYDFDLEWDDANDYYIDNVDLDFKLDFPHAKKIRLYLQDEFQQRKQISIAAGLSAIEELSIHHVDETGIKFLMANRQEFPKNTLVGLASGLERSDYPDFASMFPEPPDEY